MNFQEFKKQYTQALYDDAVAILDDIQRYKARELAESHPELKAQMDAEVKKALSAMRVKGNKQYRF